MNPAPRGSWTDIEQSELIEQRISIERDGSIVAKSGKVEYGQGIRTGFARIIAEELDVPIARVRVELGETDRTPWDMGTFGSMSTAKDGTRLRAAAAFARQLLLDRAARHFACEHSELMTTDGCVRTRDGRSATYEQLTDNQPLTGRIPEQAGGRPPNTSAGDAPLRVEARDIVTGRARFTADVRLPGMLRGRVVHPPVRGSRVVVCDEAKARALPGVVTIVREGDFIGVVAERAEQAQAAVDALRVEWSAPASESTESTTLALRADVGVEEALAGGSTWLEASYHLPHIAHASIGPNAAVADVRPDRADLYVTTQRPFGMQEEIARLLTMPVDHVHVHPQLMSGVYGRGNMGDAALEAARLSRAVGRPVLVQWSREDEFHHSPHRPVLDATLSAALDATGAIAAWRSRLRTNFHTYGSTALPPKVIEMTSGRNAVPPYRLGQADIIVDVVPAAIRTGAFRSLAAAPNVFASESFIDELASATGQDPIAFRLRQVDDPRLRRVLTVVAEQSGWRQRSKTDGHGLGVACAVYHGTYVAEVVEVAVTAAGRVRVERVWCAVDAGRVVHPDGARNQIEGGVQQAVSWTLFERLCVANDQVETSTWSEYPIGAFHDTPRMIDVTFTGDATVPSTGTGEPGSVPTAAAIANAVFDACGVRVRQLPLAASAMLSDRSR